MTTDLKADLQATRDFLASHKWGQGYKADRPEDTYCVLQCAQALFGLANRYLAVSDALDKTARELGATQAFPSIGYNDAPGRTKEEVLALIDKTIEGVS